MLLALRNHYASPASTFTSPSHTLAKKFSYPRACYSGGSASIAPQNAARATGRLRDLISALAKTSEPIVTALPQRGVVEVCIYILQFLSLGHITSEAPLSRIALAYFI
jgi:hypothetical protein